MLRSGGLGDQPLPAASAGHLHLVGRLLELVERTLGSGAGSDERALVGIEQCLGWECLGDAPACWGGPPGRISTR